MDWSLLSFLAEPWFVLPWYAVGAAGAVWVALDLGHGNTPLKQAMKWAWPIIVLFFSVLGLALYFLTARAPGVGETASDAEKRRLHEDFERNAARRVNGAVIHCVAGDGLGVMTAMVIARVTGMTFWQEFWFEYAVGFAFGWLIFQWKSMSMMTERTSAALAMAFRGEFFSMLSVMGGMGAVMTFVTPCVVGAQPSPLTTAFWGFGMLGLLVGYVFTYPMNWVMVRLGWKHGMGSEEGSRVVRERGARLALIGSMAALGAAALLLPAWLTQLREGRPVGGVAAPAGAPPPVGAGRGQEKGPLLAEGLRESLSAAERRLETGPRSEATNALDAALRAARVGAEAAPDASFAEVALAIEEARHALQMGDPRRAREIVVGQRVEAARVEGGPAAEARRYRGVPLLNARGVVVGEITDVRGSTVDVALGGVRDLFGLWDVSARRRLSLPADAIVLGPRHMVGKSYAMLPTLESPGELGADAGSSDPSPGGEAGPS